VARIGVLLVVLVALLPACSGSSVPAFCGVTDEARVAISNVPPEQYPAAAAAQVDAVRAAAEELSGDQGELARKVADDLEAASKATAGTVEFTEAYNAFVADSNEFNHAYCNEPEVD